MTSGKVLFLCGVLSFLACSCAPEKSDSNVAEKGPGKVRSSNASVTYAMVDSIGVDSDAKVVFLDSMVGVVASKRGIFTTMNGGKTWKVSPPFKPYFHHASPVDAFIARNKIFILTADHLYEFSTKDQRWEQVTELVPTRQLTTYLRAAVIDDSVAMLQGEYHDGYSSLGHTWTRTTDNWKTFKQISLEYKLYHELCSDPGRITFIKFIDKVNGMMYDHNGQLLRSSDGGNNWIVYPSAKDFNRLETVAFASNAGCIVALDDQKMRYSNDTGSSWVDQETSDTVSLTKFAFSPSGKYGIGLEFILKNIIVTNDYGYSWKVHSVVTPEFYLQDVSAAHEGSFVAVAADGRIMKFDVK